MILSLIAAADEDNVIGLGNTLPWDLPADLKHFRKITQGHCVIMGRKTFESIVEKLGHPLPKRRNIVISKSIKRSDFGPELQDHDIDIVASLDDAVDLAKRIVDDPSYLSFDKQEKTPEQGEAFVIGGEQIYQLALPFAERIYLTRIHAQVDGDKFFPELPDNDWKVVSEERHEADSDNPHAFTFFVYERT